MTKWFSLKEGVKFTKIDKVDSKIGRLSTMLVDFGTIDLKGTQQ